MDKETHYILGQILEILKYWDVHPDIFNKTIAIDNALTKLAIIYQRDEMDKNENSRY
jgi:hypothetical protein